MPAKIRFGVYELDRDAMELRKSGACCFGCRSSLSGSW
jgi:hypothetical protein